MKCPKCDATLEKTVHDGVEVDRCPQCRGIWFDEDELPAFLKLTRKELRKLQTSQLDDQMNRKRGACPRDGKEMLRVYSARNDEVVIDACASCGGIWLDDGELAKLADS